MRYLVDSTFLIDHLRGDQAARARFRRMFEDGDEPVVNEVVVCEVAGGMLRLPHPDLTALLEAPAGGASTLGVEGASSASPMPSSSSPPKRPGLRS